MNCYCPSNPQITCAHCAPVTCACGRTIPVAILRRAFDARKGVVCTCCGARTAAAEVDAAYLGA